MSDRLTIFTCLIVILICASHITDMILTAKEEAYDACIHANSAADNPADFCN